MQALPVLGISFLFIAKIFILIAIVIYLIFALVVIRQISLMIETLDVGFELPIRLLGYIHLGLALLVLILALIIL